MSALRLFTCLAVILLGSSLAAASPLTYQESVSGDLPQLHGGLTLALDIGTNTVSGSSRVEARPIGEPFDPLKQDFDSFDLLIASGSHLISATYSFTVTNFSDTAIVNGPGNSDFRLDGGIAQSVLIPGVSPVSLFGGQLPVGAGVHPLQNSQLGVTGCLCFIGDFIEWNYTWTFQVSPEVAGVPEPATLGLLGPGLAAVVAVGWRHARRMRRTLADDALVVNGGH